VSWTKNTDLLVRYMENHFSTPMIWLDEQGIIMDCNGAFYEMLGQREKPIGQNIRHFLVADTVSQCVLPSMNERHIKTVWHFGTPNDVSSFDCHILRKDSQIIVITEKVLVTGDPIIAQMGALNLEMANMSRKLMKDNVGLENANKILKKEITNNLIQVERLISLATLSTGIAHEITQPLNSLKLAADSALYYHKQGRSLAMKDILECMENISNQASNIDGIIRHIRSLVNKEPIDMVICDFNLAIRDALPAIQRLAENKGILVAAVLSTQNLMVLGNVVGLSEIVTNLINNSVVALQTTDIAEKKITLKTKDQKDKIIIEITDNGPGIPKEFQDKIFEPFFTVAGKRGMGMGLSIVKAIVIAHNGTITVNSEMGNGTTFIVELPLYQGVGEGVVDGYSAS